MRKSQLYQNHRHLIASTVPEYDISGMGLYLVASAVSLIHIFLPGGSTTLSGAAHDQPVYSGMIRQVRGSTQVLDDLLYHENDLEAREHYTDTAGFTDHAFTLVHLLGFTFCP